MRPVDPVEMFRMKQQEDEEQEQDGEIGLDRFGCLIGITRPNLNLLIP